MTGNKVIEYIIAARDKTAAGINSAKNGIKNFAKAVGHNLMNIKAGFDMLAGAVSTIGNTIASVIGTAFKFERVEAEFKTLLGSVDAAKAHIEDLRKMGAATPLTFEDLARASKLLHAFGSTTAEVMPALQMLGDIAMGDSQKFQGLALVFAQVKSQGKLMGQDLLQFVNQGFNPLREISDATGVSMSELKEIMSEGGITFDLVAEALAHATDNGGKFHDAMKTSSTTGEGLISTLKDNWTNAVAKFGESFVGVSKNGIQVLIDKLNELDKNGIIERLGERFCEMFAAIAKAVAWTLSTWDKLVTKLESFGAGVGAFVGTLVGGGTMSDAAAAFERESSDTYAQFTQSGVYGDGRTTTSKETPKADQIKAEAARAAAENQAAAVNRDKKMKQLLQGDPNALSKEEDKILEDFIRHGEANDSAERTRILKIYKEQRKKQIATVKKSLQQQKNNLNAEQKAEANAAERLSNAKINVAEAWGWVRDTDAMRAQLEEEEESAKAEKKFQKDFARLKEIYPNWKTAQNLSARREAVRRLALAREEEDKAKKDEEQARKNIKKIAENTEKLDAKLDDLLAMK